MYLFFDTETTGLPNNYQAPASDLDNWPRLVQLAWQVYNEEEELLETHNYIIKPEGFIIPPESTAVHRISQTQAEQEGWRLVDVMEVFAQAINSVDYLVAHNISFDEKIVGAEFIRTNVSNTLALKPRVCTMKSSVDFCQIPGRMNGYKWPSLAELHQRLFNQDFVDAHDALVDVRACARCFFELKRKEII